MSQFTNQSRDARLNLLAGLIDSDALRVDSAERHRHYVFAQCYDHASIIRLARHVESLDYIVQQRQFHHLNLISLH